MCESRVRPPQPIPLPKPNPGGDEGPSPPRRQHRSRRCLGSGVMLPARVCRPRTWSRSSMTASVLLPTTPRSPTTRRRRRCGFFFLVFFSTLCQFFWVCMRHFQRYVLVSQSVHASLTVCAFFSKPSRLGSLDVSLEMPKDPSREGFGKK